MKINVTAEKCRRQQQPSWTQQRQAGFLYNPQSKALGEEIMHDAYKCSNLSN